MKKLFSILAIAAMVCVGSFSAQANTYNANSVHEVITSVTTSIIQDEEAGSTEAADESTGFHQELKKRFIEGGPGFMGIVLLCLILGLAISIERIITLNLATTNTKKLLSEVDARVDRESGT